MFAALYVPALYLGLPVVAGLDAVRFGWAPLPASTLPFGVALHLFSMVPVAWSMAMNPHLETTVRIQTDRGHRVITTGPYGFVMHPMYFGAILQFLAVPLILGLAWAYAASGVLSLLMVVRAALEDATLQRELPGYEEYAGRTRFRLLPGVWWDLPEGIIAPGVSELPKPLALVLSTILFLGLALPGCSEGSSPDPVPSPDEPAWPEIVDLTGLGLSGYAGDLCVSPCGRWAALAGLAHPGGAGSIPARLVLADLTTGVAWVMDEAMSIRVLEITTDGRYILFFRSDSDAYGLYLLEVARDSKGSPTPVHPPALVGYSALTGAVVNTSSTSPTSMSSWAAVPVISRVWGAFPSIAAGPSPWC